MRDGQLNVLVAVPNPSFGKSLQKAFEQKDVKVLDLPISVEFLFEAMEQAARDGSSVDAVVIGSDLAKKLGDTRLEFLADSLYTMRERYPNTSIILLSNEKPGHPFLAECVKFGIYNIYIKGQDTPTIGAFLADMENPKPFSAVNGLLLIDEGIRWRKETSQLQANKIVIETKHTGGDARSDRKEAAPIIKEEVIINKQVIKRQVKVEFTNQVERTVGVAVERKLLLVGSASPRTGSTFVSHLLAKTFADLGVSVQYLESPFSSPYVYDRFSGHQEAPEYRSRYARLTERLNPTEKRDTPYRDTWQKDGISLVALHPFEKYGAEEVTFEVFTKLLLGSSAVITIIDIGTDWMNEAFQELYEIADRTLLVVEPDISTAQHVLDSSEPQHLFIQSVMKDTRTRMVGNRFTPTIRKNEVFQELYGEGLSCIVPPFPADEVFQAQYEGEFLKLTKEAAEQLQGIAMEILPAEFVKQKKKENSFLRGLFGRKIMVTEE